MTSKAHSLKRQGKLGGCVWRRGCRQRTLCLYVFGEVQGEGFGFGVMGPLGFWRFCVVFGFRIGPCPLSKRSSTCIASWAYVNASATPCVIERCAFLMVDYIDYRVVRSSAVCVEFSALASGCPALMSVRVSGPNDLKLTGVPSPFRV